MRVQNSPSMSGLQLGTRGVLIELLDVHSASLREWASRKMCDTAPGPPEVSNCWRLRHISICRLRIRQIAFLGSAGNSSGTGKAALILANKLRRSSHAHVDPNPNVYNESSFSPFSSITRVLCISRSRVVTQLRVALLLFHRRPGHWNGDPLRASCLFICS